MSIAELQNKIINQVKNINEVYLLEELLNLIEVESKADSILEVPESHLESIKTGLQQIEEGKVHTNEAVQNKIKNSSRNSR